MASANALGFLLPLGGIGAAGIAGMSALHIDWKTMATNFVTGPGRTSRILLALFVVVNWKSMPFVWTVRPPPTPASSFFDDWLTYRFSRRPL